ncbi:MAG TPA: Uma2 family endonuclease [Isosphaeraceae bacterium]|nr:Uma2 family endonuclease [Isosphaeraceae bacterium]
MATTSAVRIGPTDHGRRLTLEEYLDAEEVEGYAYELARGVLEVTQVPDDPHGLIEWFLFGRLRDYERDHPGVFFRVGGGSSTRIVLPGLVSGRNPDIAIVPGNALRDERGRRQPAMVIEVVSEGREAHDRDYMAKKQEYLAFGLLEYWIVDRFERKVTVLIRRGDVWSERVFSGDQAAEGLFLPGFSIHMVDLWAAAESDLEI